MSCITPQTLFTHFYAETTYGTKPGSPTRVLVPLEDYGVAVQQRRGQSRPRIGLRVGKHSHNTGHMLSGQISGKLTGYHPSGLSKSIAQYLMEFAFPDPDADLDSFGVESAQGPDVANQQHNGLVFGSFTLSGSEDDDSISFTADLMGKSEEALATAAAIPNDLEKLSQFDFSGSQLVIDGASTPTEFRGLQLQNQLNTTLKYNANRTPSVVCRGEQVITFSYDIYKDDDVYHAIKRASSAGTDTYQDIALTLFGRHNGSSTNTYTQLDIDMPYCHVLDVVDRIDVPTVSTISLQVLKPDSASEAIALTWSTS